MTSNHPIHVSAELLAYRAKLAEQVTVPVNLIPVDRKPLAPQNVIITGGNSGIGAAMAVAFAEAGSTVTVADIRIDPVEEGIAKALTAGFKIQLVECDVTSWQSQKAAFEDAAKFGRDGKLHQVIANAGVTSPRLDLAGPDSPFAAPSPPDEDPLAGVNAIDVCLKGVYYSTMLAGFYLRDPQHAIAPVGQDPPQVSNVPNSLTIIGSIASYAPHLPVPAYTAAKHGARGLFKSIRYTFIKEGIRCNLIAPTWIRTPMSDATYKNMVQIRHLFGKKEHVVELALLLAADSSISGRALGVGHDGVFDLRDDLEGESGGIAFGAFIARANFPLHGM